MIAKKRAAIAGMLSVIPIVKKKKKVQDENLQALHTSCILSRLSFLSPLDAETIGSQGHRATMGCACYFDVFFAHPSRRNPFDPLKPQQGRTAYISASPLGWASGTT